MLSLAVGTAAGALGALVLWRRMARSGGMARVAAAVGMGCLTRGMLVVSFVLVAWRMDGQAGLLWGLAGYFIALAGQVAWGIEAGRK